MKILFRAASLILHSLHPLPPLAVLSPPLEDLALFLMAKEAALIPKELLVLPRWV